MVKYKETQIDDIFHALSDPTRRKILQMVSRRDRQATELANMFDISFPAVSKHLKVLERARLITRMVDGRVHRFHFEDKTMKKAYQWIKFYKRFWVASLNRLDSFLTEQKHNQGGQK